MVGISRTPLWISRKTTQWVKENPTAPGAFATGLGQESVTQRELLPVFRGKMLASRSVWKGRSRKARWSGRPFSASKTAQRGNENARQTAVNSSDDPVVRYFFTRRLRDAPGHLRGVEGNNSGERCRRQRQVARTCGTDSKPKWRRAHRDSRLYASAGWARPGSDQFGRRFQRCSDNLRPKSVSVGRVHRSDVSRHGERNVIDRNNRHDFKGALWNGNKHRPARSEKAVSLNPSSGLCARKPSTAALGRWQHSSRPRKPATKESGKN